MFDIEEIKEAQNQKLCVKGVKQILIIKPVKIHGIKKNRILHTVEPIK
jgi:hypothetical protein